MRWLSELKIDGLAISLAYRDGVLETATTRGDGRIGEDITENVELIPVIPRALQGDGFPRSSRCAARCSSARRISPR